MSRDQNKLTVQRLDVRLMYPENMKQLAYIVSKTSNGLDKTIKVKVIISRSMVQKPSVNRSHARLICPEIMKQLPYYMFLGDALDNIFKVKVIVSSWRSKVKITIKCIHFMYDWSAMKIMCTFEANALKIFLGVGYNFKSKSGNVKMNWECRGPMLVWCLLKIWSNCGHV